MGQVSKGPTEPISDGNLRRVDRRNNIILAVIGVPMAVMSLCGVLTGNHLLPQMWSELSIVVAMGLLYNWAIRKHRIDLRLGLVYTAAGILVSLPLFIVGFMASVLMFSYNPFLVEEDLWSFLSILPAGLFALIAFKVSRLIGLKVAEKQWQMLHQAPQGLEEEHLNGNALYLAEKKWTDSWFYLSLFLLAEMLPILLRAATPRALNSVVIIVGIFIVFLGRAYYILKKG